MDALMYELGRMMGDFWAQVAIVVFYLLFVLLVWGLPCDRIISKAGFDGKTHLGLFAMMFSPVLVVPAVERSNLQSDFANTLTGLSAALFFMGLLYIAFAPWPVWKEIRQLRQKLGIRTD